MILKSMEKIIKDFGVWRSLQGVLVLFSLSLLVAGLYQLFVPAHAEQFENQENILIGTKENVTAFLHENKNKAKEQIAYRPGMFKSATGLADKPLANKTIDRIKDQLKLQCVMEINGKQVAYINIQGMGLRKCGIGENINGLFTVLDINKQNNSVDVLIVEHKVTLH